MLTKEELLAAVRAEAEKVGEKQSVESIKAIQEFMAERFKVPIAETVVSPGQQFAMDLAIRDFVSSKSKNSAPVAIKGLHGYGLKSGEYLPPRAKATIDTTFFPSERTYLPPAEFPQRGYRLRDLIPVAGLGTPQVEYARITGYTNSAGGVAEGGTKPQSAITTSVITESVANIATFIPVTRQAMNDVPALAAYINQVLRYFLQLEEDRQILNGLGAASNELSGLLNVTGILTHSQSAVAGDTAIDAVRRGITKLQLAFGDAGFDATGVVLHPNDWEQMELYKSPADERYILIPMLGTPADGAPPRIWRIPVVVTPAITENTGLLAAFDIAATLWTYEDVTLRVTDSHSDWFIKNLLAVLAEFRELLATYFPKALLEITFT